MDIEITHDPEGPRTMSMAQGTVFYCQFKFDSTSVMDDGKDPHIMTTWADCLGEYDIWLEALLKKALSGNPDDEAVQVAVGFEKILNMAMEPGGVKLFCPFHLSEKMSPASILIRHLKDAMNATGIFAPPAQEISTEEVPKE